MVQLVVKRREGCFDIGEIHHPSQLGIRLAVHVNFDTEGMTMQPRAFVPLGHVRQTMGGFDLENFEDMHAAMLPAPARTLSRARVF